MSVAIDSSTVKTIARERSRAKVLPATVVPRTSVAALLPVLTTTVATGLSRPYITGSFISGAAMAAIIVVGELGEHALDGAVVAAGVGRRT